MKYDVVIDLPKNKLIVRNPLQAYVINSVAVVPKTTVKYVAHLTEDFELDPETQEVREFVVKRKRQHEQDYGRDSVWQGYVETSRNGKLIEKGVGIASSLISIRDGRTKIPILNANQQLTSPDNGNRLMVSVRDTTTQIYPIKTEYDRRYRNGDPYNWSDGKGHIKNIRMQEMDNVDEWRIVPDVRDEPEHSYGNDSLREGETTLCTRSHMPLSVKEEDKTKTKEFVTRPPTEHLQEELSIADKQELEDVLDEYAGLFSQSASDIGYTTLVEHEIIIEAGARPPKEALRRMSPEKKQKAADTIKMLSEQGMIIPSMSPYASAIVFAKKNDGSARFCVDYRRVNDITIKDAFPLPRIDDSVEKLSGCKYFTSLDMGNAFWQVRMEPKSRQATAFVTHDALWEWTVMPFGLCNATSTFQRLMSKVLSSLVNTMGNIVLCYVDDILIASATATDHLWKMRQVFRCLQEAGLKLKAGKCNMMDKKIKFLGRIINEDGIQPDPANIEKVQNWGRPTSRKTLESFIGFANYYREYIRDFATIVAPLNHLKRKGVEFVWTDATEKSFTDLIEKLTTAPLLALPNDDGRYVLDTDASVVAIAGVLQQEQEWKGVKKLRVISYGSRGLRAAERNYGAPKAEMLAAVTFIENNRCYLLPKEFTLRCDNIALQWLKTYSVNHTMVARMIQRLDGFNFKFEHRDRRLHTNADGISKMTRYYDRVQGEEERQHAILGGVTFVSQKQWDAIQLLPIDERKPTEREENSDETKIEMITCNRHVGIESKRQREQERQDKIARMLDRLYPIPVDGTGYNTTESSNIDDGFSSMDDDGDWSSTDVHGPLSDHDTGMSSFSETEWLDKPIERYEDPNNPNQDWQEQNKVKATINAMNDFQDLRDLGEYQADSPPPATTSAGSSDEEIRNTRTKRKTKRCTKTNTGGVVIMAPEDSFPEDIRAIQEVCVMMMRPKYTAVEIQISQQQDGFVSTVISYL